MLGSVHDAEDLVQETLIRAWRGYDRFEGRSSLRTWLHTIATRACLTELSAGHRRVLPSGLAGPAEEGSGFEPNLVDVPWLQPLPDDLLADPAAVAEARAGTRLALVAAMQLLPARARAVLILRDVLRWPAAEVAEALGTSRDAVNSAVLRARAQLAGLAPPLQEVVEPDTAQRRAVLDRYVRAFHDGDVEGLVALLREDVTLEMPPRPTWFAGRPAVAGFFREHVTVPGRLRLVEVSANSQPAAVAYLRREDGRHHAHGVHVLAPSGGELAAIVVFLGAHYAGLFGLPEELPQELP
jgi:RNA polymerase sigma-70 factor (ECF subfamily)